MIYEFGEFRLDPENKSLFCEDQPVLITPKVFDTLQYFVENPGRLLKKDELLTKIWEERFVEESNLTFNIRMLRLALKDDAQQPRYIQTVPRRGYRFIAEVKQQSSAVTEPIQTAVEARAETLPNAPPRAYLKIALLSVLIAGSVAFAYWFLSSRRTRASSRLAPILSAPFKSEKFSNTGNRNGVITPDGKYVAYTSESGGKHSVWLRQLETSENIQIVPPGDKAVEGLAFSNDGNSLYFVRESPEDLAKAIYRVMTFGGIPARIAERAENWISVSPDDRQVSFVRCEYQPDDHCSLFVVGVDGRNERKVLTRSRPTRISDHQFSPDGKSIVFAYGQSTDGGSDFHLARLDLATGAESQVSPKAFFVIKCLRWLPGTEDVILTAKENGDGRLRVWLVSTVTGTPRVVTDDAANYNMINLNRAADKMIATQVSNSFHVYFVPGNEFGSAKSLAAARSVAFAPNGKIMYVGDDGDIWTINRDGGEQRQLTNHPATDRCPLASPDGQYIFFNSNRTGLDQLWRMNADGSNQIQLTREVGGCPQFVSADGKWIYLDSGLLATLWRIPNGGGQEERLSERRVLGPAFSPDGSLVAFFFRDVEQTNRVKLAVMSVASQQIIKTVSLPDESPAGVKIAWSEDDKYFYYVTTNGSKYYLWHQPLAGDRPRLIADFDEEVGDFAFAPNGAGLALVRGQWIHELVLIKGLG